METLKKIDHSKTSVIIIYCLIFLLMLLCNFLTPLVADDFGYSFNWTTGERTSSLRDIFLSLKSHYASTNGRMFAHFFAFLFLWLPRPIFKVCNTGMFLLLIWRMYRICLPKEKRSAVLLLTIFCLIWCMEPEFGEVNLWIDGACNYLWGGVISMLYLAPLLLCICRDQKLSRSPWYAIVTMLLGFVSGAYLENVSAAVIFMTFLLLLLIRFYKKQRIPVYQLLAFVLSIAGYLFMILAPGERVNKYGGLSMAALRENFITALGMYQRFWPLLLVLGCLFLLSLHYKLRAENRWIALVLFLGSLAANFIFMFASYYPARGAFFSVLLLTLAICLLLPELLETSSAIVLSCAIWALLLVTSYQMLIGVNDIYCIYGTSQQTIELIESSKATGELDVVAPRPMRKTEYAVVGWNPGGAKEWPNTTIAQYYGLHSFDLR